LNTKKLIIAVTGASGAIYAQLLLEKTNQLKQQLESCALVLSDNGRKVWQYELGSESYTDFSFDIYKNDDMFSPIASGSAAYDTMIICPCSMGTMGRIATGISDNLIVRAADVMLKERKKLILVTREMPLNLIHINNMKALTEAGAIICPASPSFYHLNKNTNEILMTVIDKILILAGFTFEHPKWGNV